MGGSEGWGAFAWRRRGGPRGRGPCRDIRELPFSQNPEFLSRLAGRTFLSSLAFLPALQKMTPRRSSRLQEVGPASEAGEPRLMQLTRATTTFAAHGCRAAGARRTNSDDSWTTGAKLRPLKSEGPPRKLRQMPFT